MAHIKHAVTGTEVECDDATARAMAGDGWKAVTSDDGNDKPHGRRKPARKDADGGRDVGRGRTDR